MSLLFNYNLLFQSYFSLFILLLPPIFELSKLMWIWIILMHVFDHQSCWAPENILYHFFWTALAYSSKFSFHPFCMRLIQISQLQKWIPPFCFHPRPYSFNRIEIRWAWRQIFRSCSIVLQKVLDLYTPMCSVIIHDYHFVIKLFTIFYIFCKNPELYQLMLNKLQDEIKNHSIHW